MRSKGVKVWVVWERHPKGRWVAMTARVRRENAMRAAEDFRGSAEVRLTSGTVMPPRVKP